MPRNGSGTMSISNSFSANTTIESAKVNANFTDIASEITASLARNGESSMSGQFKAADGTSGAPGISYSSDPDLGFYRSAANTMAVAGTLTSNGTNKYDSFPAGTAMLFVQTAAPTGWTKDTTHNNKALRIVSGTASSGGATAFTSVFTSRTIAEANLPPHTHTFSATTCASGAHAHFVFNEDGATSGTARVSSSTTPANRETDGGNSQDYDIRGTATAATAGISSPVVDHTHTVSGTTSSVGSGTAMDFAVQYVDVIAATKDA